MDGQIRSAKEDERWQSIEIMVRSNKSDMKDFLLDRAEKPRDLYLCKGRVRGLDLCSNTFFSIQHEYKSRLEEEARRKEEEPLMDMMEDGEPAEDEVVEINNISDLYEDSQEEE